MYRIRIAIAGAACVGLAASWSPAAAIAGNLGKCDQERLAARAAVLGRYDALLSELDQRIAATKAAFADPRKAVYRDKDDQPRSLDLLALRADLQTQESHDAGSVDKAVAASCGDHAETAADAAKIADALAARGIANVLPKHVTNVDASRYPLGF